MEKDEIQKIWAWAQQPRKAVWSEWLKLLKPKGVPLAQLQEYKPPMVEICEPLLGLLVKKRGKLVNRQLGSCERRAIYKEALQIIETFRSYGDLATLAIYRRQVTNANGVAVLDSHFLRLVRLATPSFSPAWLQDIAIRMPPHSKVKRELEALAQARDQQPDIPQLLLAA
jgi:hypothetical protein